MNVVKSALLDESYYEHDHPSGLKILVYPKEGYQSAYAIFGTRYGSIDTRFRLKGEQEWTVVPEGIAHFLEHTTFQFFPTANMDYLGTFRQMQSYI